MKSKLFIKLYFYLIFFLSINLTQAQDTHYWNIQYGTRSTLLGGAVIGSVSDLSATYYNPGAVALFKDPKLVLSAKVYEYHSMVVEDGAGKGKDLKFSSINPSPTFVAFAFDFDWLGDDQLAVSILTRQQMNTEFATRKIEPVDIYPDEPGEEDFAGGISFDQKFNEIWAGLTYSTKLSEVLGIGITGYFAYRSQKFNRQVIIKVLHTDDKISSLTDFDNYNYSNLRALLKFGIGYNFQPLTLGLTVTTPSLNMFGSGSTGNHFFLSGVDLDEDGTDDNIFESNYQEDIPSTYNSPWSIGFGGAYKFNDLKIHLSGEWYDKVNQYEVLTPDSYYSQSSEEEISNTLSVELKSVLNFGLGLDYFITEKLIISGSFITDYSARVPGTTSSLAISNWDIYHISGGVTFPVGKSDLTFGFTYAFGSEEVNQILDLDAGEEGNIGGQTTKTTVVVKQIKFLLGFNF